MHAWMQAWLIGARHPYVAVTDARGGARLDKVPAGSHDVVFWHERLGTAVRKAESPPGRTLASTSTTRPSRSGSESLSRVAAHWIVKCV